MHLTHGNISERPKTTNGARLEDLPPVDKQVDLDGDGALSLNEVGGKKKTRKHRSNTQPSCTMDSPLPLLRRSSIWSVSLCKYGKAI